VEDRLLPTEQVTRVRDPPQREFAEEDRLPHLPRRRTQRVEPDELTGVVMLQEPGERETLPPTEFRPPTRGVNHDLLTVGADRVRVRSRHEARPHGVSGNVPELLEPFGAIPHGVIGSRRDRVGVVHLD
jgi:hypothetical protein